MRRRYGPVVWTALAWVALALASCDSTGRQATFATPDEAAVALVAAIESEDLSAMLRVLGEEAEPLIESGDPVDDRNRRSEFTALYAKQKRIVEAEPGRSILLVGEDEWPFPFSIVSSDGRWHYDTSSGVEEIVNRRVGSNELSAIQASLAYVDAQHDYFAYRLREEGAGTYARALVSAPGKKDGLFWETATEEEPRSPLGAAFARARGEGYAQADGPQPQPFYGYYYRVLEAQGPHAAGGALDYVVDGRMPRGFALVAFPADRGSTGVMTFIVNQDGAVFSKDLGPETATLAAQMTTFDPDPTWTREDGG